MTKQEFEELLSESKWKMYPKGSKKPHITVSNREWEYIELVYTWYPSLSCNSEVAKPIVVYLYNSVGIAAFEDMAERAKLALQLDKELRVKQAEVDIVKRQIKDLTTLKYVEDGLLE